jgi:hypothetical protein
MSLSYFQKVSKNAENWHLGGSFTALSPISKAFPAISVKDSPISVLPSPSVPDASTLGGAIGHQGMQSQTHIVEAIENWY